MYPVKYDKTYCSLLLVVRSNPQARSLYCWKYDIALDSQKKLSVQTISWHFIPCCFANSFNHFLREYFLL